MDDASLWAEAERKARYGHRDWVVWRDEDNTLRTAPVSVESMKAALLATGSRRHFYLIGANDANTYIYRWWMGVNHLSQLKRGYVG
jgi:hypothetical protein